VRGKKTLALYNASGYLRKSILCYHLRKYYSNPSGLGVGLGWRCGPAGTPSLLTHQFQAKPCRCSRRVASIIERIDLGGASNVMRVLIKLTAATAPLKGHSL